MFRKCFTLVLLLLTVCSIFMGIFIMNRNRLVQTARKFTMSASNSYDNPERLLKLMRHIIRAHRYSRNGKAIYELNQAYNIIQTLMDESKNDTISEHLDKKVDLNFTERELVVGNKKEEPEICPEVYMGMMHDGYSYYSTGYKTDHRVCVGKSLGSLVTILVNIIDDLHLDDLDSVLLGLKKYYPTTTILVGHSANQNVVKYLKYKNVIPVTISDQTSGTVWKKLAQKATTKYLFVARHLLQIDNHTFIERLLRFVSYNVADAVGTSHSYLDGRWFRGCHASALRNYTLKFVDGYDLSYNSCIYCDYLTGPFVIIRDTFIKYLDPNLHVNTVFVDMFTKMSHEFKTILSCQDVRVTVVEKELQNLTTSDWLPFVQKWQINRIVFTNGKDLLFSCEESRISCDMVGGMIRPICCLKELTDMMKFTFETLSENNIEIELEGGSNVGAAKINKNMPYELDADFNWLVSKHKKLANLKPYFARHGYQLVEDKNDYKCCGNLSAVNCGYFRVKSSNWYIELWGANYLGSEETFRVGLQSRTKVLLDGMWMTSYYSPANAARNQYGDDVYQHIEHWRTLGYSSGWVQPKTGRWIKCPEPGFHSCLDLYLPVGDIQFKDIWI